MKRVLRLTALLVAVAAGCGILRSVPAQALASPCATLLGDERIDSSFNYEIITINTCTGEKKRLTNTPDIAEYAPRWSPDGRLIVFSRFNGRISHISIADPTFTHIRDLNSSYGGDGFASFSPDGKTIAFQKTQASAVNIWMINTDGTNERQITFDTNLTLMGDFSPDGRFLYVTTQHWGGLDIARLDLQTRALMRLTPYEGIDNGVRVSPDGKKLLYYSNRGPTTNDIWIMNSDGSDERVLIAKAFNELGAAWSADGQHISYRSDTRRAGSLQYSLEIANSDGSDQRWVADVLIAASAGAWQPAPQLRYAVRGGTDVVATAGSYSGAWTTSVSGRVTGLDGAPVVGSLKAAPNAAIVGIAAAPLGVGYWLSAADGGVFSFGSSKFYGSMGNRRLNQPVVGMAATPLNEGYWLTASDGGIFSFGDAKFFGSTGAMKLNSPIVGMAATPSGNGYWLVASDGGVFSFGDAKFYGSTGNRKLNQPIVSITPNLRGDGYWLTAKDGGVFTFGNADFQGSAVGKLSGPAVGMTVSVG